VSATFPGGATVQTGVGRFRRRECLANDLGVCTSKIPKEVVTDGAHSAQKSTQEFGQEEFREVVPDGGQAVQANIAFPRKMHHSEALR
jgi:hypothetical protein